MIRVMIVEDEPHAQRRLQRMIERLDDFFRVEATALDGEEALERLKTVRCDVVFTDIRMPIMDGTELMQRVRRQYPEIMLVVLSGYSDFSYVSEAVRSQAVDYLLKPLTEEALAKLLAQLKERYLAREHEQIRRKLAARINKATPPRGGENAADEQLGAFLLCAGALPICESTDMCPGAEFWSGGALREAANETINELSTFTWEFMGNTPAERIVILRADLGELPQIAALLHSAVVSRADMPVSCACHREPIALSEIDRTLRALRKELERHGRIGESLLLEASDDPWRPRGDEAAVQEAASALNNGDEALLAQLFNALRRKNGRRGALPALFHGHHADLRQQPQRLCPRATAARGAGRFHQLSADDGRIARRPRLPVRKRRGKQRRNGLGGPAHRAVSAQKLRRTHHQPDAGRRIWLCAQLCEHALPARIRRVALGIPHRHPHRAGQAHAAGRPQRPHPRCGPRRGFKSQHHFSRTFKNHEGVWPSDFVHERRPG